MYHRISTILDLCEGPRVLDIGCAGKGTPSNNYIEKYYLHHHLIKKFPEVVGIDINSVNVKGMIAAGYKNILVMDAEDLDPSLLGKYDTIVAGDIIEHLSNPGHFLKGAVRCLNSKGRIVIATPNPFNPMFFFMYLKNYLRAFHPEHALWMCPQTLLQLADRYGLRVTRICFSDSLMPEIISSIWYKSYALFWKIIKYTLPKRIRGWFIVSLEPI
jgi:2-polyprenyl-3-methyl-5-hydroxy-6-metoxy-1,4-benzoquinol methylase